MTATRKSRKNNTPKFENRTRFNWGYHDAAQAVKQGWCNVANNYGFGPAIKIETASDVLIRHTDKEYAEGWYSGYCDAISGEYANDSTKAWNAAMLLGKVSE